MITWPETLIEDIARRRCVLFLGSGVSKNSVNDHGRRPCNWLEFLEKASNQIIENSDKKLFKKLISERDFLTACEVIKNSIGDEDFVNLVEEEYLTPGYKSADIHDLIFRLDSRIVLTPNFDKIYETYANNVSEGTVKVKNYYADDISSVVRGKRDDRTIIKIHGTVDEPNKLIFSRKDYVAARSKNRDFYSQLEALIMTHTFLFIGCGLDDPDIRLLLEDYAHKFTFSRSHFFLSREKTTAPQIKKIVASTMKLKFLEYSGKGADHSKLTSSIEELVKLVEIKKSELASDQDW